MDAKEIDLACPACRVRLAIDVRTARVLRWAEPTETDPLGRPKVTERDWDAAVGRVRAREDRVGDLFETALAREREREGELDARFAAMSDRSGGPDAATAADRRSGRSLADAIVHLEVERGLGDPWVLDRAGALEAREAVLRTLPHRDFAVAAAELARLGFHVGHCSEIWARSVGARPRADVTPSHISTDGLGLALTSDLDEAADPALERTRIDGALVAAESEGAGTLAVRSASFSKHEAWLAEVGFRRSHFEQVWVRTSR